MAELRGYIRFNALTDNAEDFLNALHGGDLSVFGAEVKNGIVSGEIHWYELEKLKNIAENNSASLQIASRKGFIYKLLPYRKRGGIAVGIVLAAAMIFYLSNIVMKIEVYGSDSMSDKEIISILNDNGIKIGTFIPSIDFYDCEKRALASTDRLRKIYIHNVGCRIIADVSDMTSKPEMIADDVPCNIVSTRDAQIVGIKNVYMGMLVPMLYDGVKKGELLISGTVDGKLDRDYYVHAMGEIIGRYNESADFFQPYSEDIRSYGDSFTRKSFYAFGLRIPLFINRNIKTEYDYSEKISYAEFLGLTLPCGIIRAEYKPYSVNSQNYSSDDALKMISDKINNYEKNFYDGENIKILNRDVTVTETENGLYAEAVYTIEGNIGTEKEIFAKKR